MEQWVINLIKDNAGNAGVLVIAFFWIRSKFSSLEHTICDLGKTKVWRETCHTTHKEVDHRLDRLEAVANGVLRP